MFGFANFETKKCNKKYCEIQESWLYLEPIFNSEDIMKQMPVEGRKFNKV